MSDWFLLLACQLCFCSAFLVASAVFICYVYVTVDGRSTTVVASNDSVPSADADDEGLEQESVEEIVKDTRVSELWMDFEVLFKCFK